jgi:hypothetical protein
MMGLKEDSGTGHIFVFLNRVVVSKVGEPFETSLKNL